MFKSSNPAIYIVKIGTICVIFLNGKSFLAPISNLYIKFALSW